MSHNNLLLFGGSFDPIHYGHLIVARATAESLHADKVILIPAAQPPHKLDRDMTAPEHRLHMAQQAVKGDGLFEVSDCELQRRGPSYTIDTIRFFGESHPHSAIYWLIGADSVADLPTWRSIAALADACTLVTARRPGFAVNWAVLKGVLADTQISRLMEYELNTPQIDISATDIRRRVKSGQSIRYLTPAPVADYITDHHLYDRG